MADDSRPPRASVLRSVGPGTRARRLVAQTAGNAGLNGATLAFNFVIALLLSRLLGADGYGAFAYAMAWALLLTVPASLGLVPVVVREVATYRVRKDWARTRGLLRRSNQAALGVALAVSVTAGVIFVALGWPEDPFFDPTIVALATVPLLVLVLLRQAAMQGFGVVVLARVPERIVAPALMIGFVLALQAALAGGLSASWAVGAQVLAGAFAALIGVYLLRRTLPDEVRKTEPLYETRAWVAGGLPILAASAIQAANLQAGTILTGSIAGPEEAGVYNVAVRIASLLPFLLLAATPSLMPLIAELDEKGSSEALQRVLTRAARLVFLGSLPLAIGAIVFAEPLLELFGEEFGAGAAALRILCLGQLVNVATGFAWTILVMVGEAGHGTWAVAAGTTLNLALSAALIPTLGSDGAAIGAAVSMATTNVLMAILLWRRCRIHSSVIRSRRAAVS